MNKLTLSILAFSVCFSLNAQVHFEKKWDHTFGGTDVETLTSLMQTSDGGFILGGHTKSDIGFEVSEALRGSRDFWIVKTDSLGNMEWDKRFGGDLDEKLFTAEETSDGGYILGGFTTSDSSFDVSERTRGSMDYWIVKTDSVGNKLWDKRFGGSNFDQLSVVHEIDAGYILGGFSISDSSGDVSQNGYGSEDFWIVVTDFSGNKIWDKRYGGDFTDELYTVEQTVDGGFMLGGRSRSAVSGDVTDTARGLADYWIIKIDVNGVKEWDSRFGGSNRDNFVYMEQINDHGYILGGYTWSDADGDITDLPRDTSTSLFTDRGDIWIVRVDSMGNKIWDKRYGGEWVEDAFGYVKQTSDGGFLWGSASYSNISGEKTENNFGYEQSWIVKIDSAGTIVWDKTLFVDGEDEYAYPIETTDGCYVIANWSYGDSVAYKTEDARGGYDFWLYKMCETLVPQLPIANFTTESSVLCEGGCFTFINQSYDAGSFEWSFPGGTPSTSTLAFPEICYADTGTYPVTLIAINNSGSDTITLANLVNVIPVPTVQLTTNGDTLFAPQGFALYQWFLDNNPLPNDTAYFLVAQLNGDYVVKVTDSAGCPATDTLLAFSVDVVEFTSNGYTISVYPNPSNSEINISGLDIVIDGRLRVFDIVGREVYSEKITSSITKINVADFIPGVYFIEATDNNNKINARFIRN